MLSLCRHVDDRGVLCPVLAQVKRRDLSTSRSVDLETCLRKLSTGAWVSRSPDGFRVGWSTPSTIRSPQGLRPHALEDRRPCEPGPGRALWCGRLRSLTLNFRVAEWHRKRPRFPGASLLSVQVATRTASGGGSSPRLVPRSPRARRPRRPGRSCLCPPRRRAAIATRASSSRSPSGPRRCSRR